MMKLQQELDKFEIPDNFQEMDHKQKMKAVWPLVRVVLTFIKLFTPAKCDRKIDVAIQAGDMFLG